MNEYQKVDDAISNINEEIDRATIKSYLKKFESTGRFDKFEERFEDFRQDVRRAAEDCYRAINSPIYVGVVGHYSHGKSSLLNAMLFPQKMRDLLPTGDSIVTGTCTLIGFKDDRQGHEFYEVKYDGAEAQISSEEYQSKVSGKRTGALQGVHHFRIKLNASDLNLGVFQSMAEKNIELLDTPGLGGPYWKDEHALQSWMKEFMLLIVAIKADAINKRVADSINPFLKYSTRPIIPVVTFWDLWDQSESYKGVNSEEDARRKACEDIIKYFPIMSDAVEEGRIAFVSAKNYRDQVSVPSKTKNSFTEDWNIDNVRNTLANYVSSKINVLQSIRAEQSDLEINRKQRVIESCKSLCATYFGLNKTLKAELEASKPKAGYEDDLDEALRKLQEDISREFDRIIDRISEKIEDRVSIISILGNWSQELSEITKDIKKETQQLFKESLPDRFERNVDRGVKRVILRYLENESPLEKTKIKRLKNNVEELCRDLVRDLTEPTLQSPFVPPQGVTDWAKNIISALLDGIKTLFTTNLPAGLAISFAILVLPLMVGFLKKIPFIGENLAGAIGFFQILIFSFGAFTLLAVSWGNVKRAREKTAMDVKDKARKHNRRADIRDRIMLDIDSRLRNFENDIRETLSEEISPLIQSGDDLSEDLDRLFSDIGSQVKVIEKECSALARGMR